MKVTGWSGLMDGRIPAAELPKLPSRVTRRGAHEAGRLPYHIGSGMIAVMQRGRTQPSIPDLFSAATARDASPAPANQVSSPKAAGDKATNTSLHRYVLPKDLPHALEQLDDSELVSLLAAAFHGAKRRDRLRPGLVARAFEGDDPTAKGLSKSNQRSKARQGHSAALSL